MSYNWIKQVFHDHSRSITRNKNGCNKVLLVRGGWRHIQEWQSIRDDTSERLCIKCNISIQAKTFRNQSNRLQFWEINPEILFWIIVLVCELSGAFKSISASRASLGIPLRNYSWKMIQMYMLSFLTRSRSNGNVFAWSLLIGSINTIVVFVCRVTAASPLGR